MSAIIYIKITYVEKFYIASFFLKKFAMYDRSWRPSTDKTAAHIYSIGTIECLRGSSRCLWILLDLPSSASAALLLEGKATLAVS